MSDRVFYVGAQTQEKKPRFAGYVPAKNLASWISVVQIIAARPSELETFTVSSHGKFIWMVKRQGKRELGASARTFCFQTAVQFS